MEKKQAQKWIVALLDTEKSLRKLQTALQKDSEKEQDGGENVFKQLSADAWTFINVILDHVQDLHENLQTQIDLRKAAKKQAKKQKAKPAEEFSPPEESNAEALRQHLLDLYGDLGVEWGADPFTRIAALKDAEHSIQNAR